MRLSLWFVLFLTPLWLMAESTMQEAIDNLAERWGGTITTTQSRLTQTDVTLGGVVLTYEGGRLEADRMHFVGAHFRGGDLLNANALMLVGAKLSLEDGSWMQMESLYLSAEDLSGFFMLLNTDWADWQNMLVLSGVKKLDIKKLALPWEGERVTLERFVLDGTRYEEGRLKSSRYRGEKLVLPIASLVDDEENFLSDLGYQELVISWQDDTSFEGRELLTLHSRTRLSIDKMGEIALEARFGNLVADFMTLFAQEEPTPSQMMAIMGLRLDQAVLTYTDRGLLPRLYAVMGAQEGVEGSAYAKKLASELRAHLMEAPKPALSAKEIEVLSGFIEKPGTLTFSLRPKEGVVLMEMAMLYAMDWRLLIERLSLRIEAAR